MKKFIVLGSLILSPLLVNAANVTVPVEIVEADVPRYVALINGKYAYLTGTTREKGQQLIILLLEDELMEFEREVKLQDARDETINTGGSVIPGD